ncbi:hypothetical protein, partial [Morganella morganii]|uniref:hypothetical protein n=1 Tax=Morganella morganii TaxID=582 RepID=UPI001952FEEC
HRRSSIALAMGSVYIYFKKWIPKEDIAIQARMELSRNAYKLLVIFVLIASLWIISDYLSLE